MNRKRGLGKWAEASHSQGIINPPCPFQNLVRSNLPFPLLDSTHVLTLEKLGFLVEGRKTGSWKLRVRMVLDYFQVQHSQWFFFSGKTGELTVTVLTFWGAGDGTQGLMHTRQLLYHWVTPQALCLFLQIFLIKKKFCFLFKMKVLPFCPGLPLSLDHALFWHTAQHTPNSWRELKRTMVQGNLPTSRLPEDFSVYDHEYNMDIQICKSEINLFSHSVNT